MSTSNSIPSTSKLGTTGVGATPAGSSSHTSSSPLGSTSGTRDFSSTSSSGPGNSTTGATSPRTNFKGFKVPEILTWKNPYETGILLAEALGLFVVFGSTLTLRYFLKIASSIIGLLSVAEWASRYVSGQRNGLVSSYQPSRFLPLSDKVVNDVANYVSHVFRKFTFGLQHLLDARDPIKGLKLAGFLYAVFVFTSFLSLKSLVLTGIIVTFSVPPLYLQFKPEVDRAIGEAQGHVHEHFEGLHKKVHEKAGPQLDYVKKFVGARGGFDTTKDVRPVGEVPTSAAKKTQFTQSPLSSTSGHTSSSSPFAATAASTTSPTASSKNPSHTSPLSSASGAKPASPLKDSGIATTTDAHDVPVAGTTAGSTKSSSALPHEDIFKNFESVPTLAGNLPIDKEKLTAALAADKAKAEGSVNGL